MTTRTNALLRLKYLLKRVSQKLPFHRSNNTQIYLRDRIEQYAKLWSSVAADVNATIKSIDVDIWEIQRGSSSIRTRLHQLPIDNDVVLKLCGRKPLVHRLLKAENLPIPEYEIFSLDSISKAQDFFKSIGGLVVVKPSDGYSGFGVTTHISNSRSLNSASIKAALYSTNLMIEQQIAGECFRLLVYKKKFVHAVKRKGLYVTGDGHQSIAKLLEQKQTSKNFSADISFTLSAQGLNLSKIPSEGKKILVSSVGESFNGGHELRTIYDEEVTDVVSPRIQADVERCAAIVGSDFLGVDIITYDITKDLRETGGVINEVNTTPALHHHYDSEKEPYPKMIKGIVEDLL